MHHMQAQEGADKAAIPFPSNEMNPSTDKAKAWLIALADKVALVAVASLAVAIYTVWLLAILSLLQSLPQ